MITAWKEYVDTVLETAAYPEAGTGNPAELGYLSLGLLGELGELNEEYCQSPTNQEAFNKKLGDVLWYLAALANWAERRLYVEALPFNVYRGRSSSNPPVDLFSFAQAAARFIRGHGDTTSIVIQLRGIFLAALEDFSDWGLEGDAARLEQRLVRTVLIPNREKFVARKNSGDSR